MNDGGADFDEAQRGMESIRCRIGWLRIYFTDHSVMACAGCSGEQIIVEGTGMTATARLGCDRDPVDIDEAPIP